MREQIAQLTADNRLGTARNYTRTLHSFSSFLGGGELPFAAFTERLVEEYNAYLLRRGVVRNTVSFYMRILRSVYNKAVRRRLAEPASPFGGVYTGVDRTRKRAIDERLIARLKNLDLPVSGPLPLARDLFVFSYCARGMAFVDMAFLRKKGHEGRGDTLRAPQDGPADDRASGGVHARNHRPLRLAHARYALSFFRC